VKTSYKSWDSTNKHLLFICISQDIRVVGVNWLYSCAVEQAQLAILNTKLGKAVLSALPYSELLYVQLEMPLDGAHLKTGNFKQIKDLLRKNIAKKELVSI